MFFEHPVAINAAGVAPCHKFAFNFVTKLN